MATYVTELDLFNAVVNGTSSLSTSGGGGGVQTSSTSTLTQVTNSATSVTLLAANANRKGFMLQNTSTSNAYVALASAATTGAYSFRMLPNSFYERVNGTIYTGLISCIWDTAPGGSMQITELT